jgi:hypothetical protein
MWKLFPNTWLERAGVFKHRHARAAEALERHWLEWLAEGLRRLNPRILDSQDSDPVEALRDLSGHGLLCLDEMLRAESVHHSHRPGSSSPPPAQDKGDEIFADAYLFVAACSPSGFIRERALDAFARYPGPLAFATGLIRSTDWVAEVRTAAIALVRSMAAELAPSDMVRFLELAVRLKDRVRVDEQLWQTCIEHRITASESREALWTAARNWSNSSLLRRCAFEYLMLGEPGTVLQVVRSALADPDPRVGLWALAQIEGLRSAKERACLLKFALAAKHAAVRRTALRRYVSLKTDDCVQSLRAALFDSARGVREVAAFELNGMAGESALPIWRAAILHPQRRVSEVAIMALCESGERGDVENLASAGVARNAVLRASILRGLWRVGSADLEPRLVSALKDRSTRVIRQATEIYRHGTSALDALTLDEALGSVEDDRAPYLIALSESLGKWAGLEFLLHQALSTDHERAECAADHLDRWILTANRKFVAPSVYQVQRLTNLLRLAQSRHPRRDWRPVDRGLAAFT